MKKMFEEPKINVIVFDSVDVITASDLDELPITPIRDEIVNF